MTIKELAQTINPDIDLFIRFNGDELVYSQPIAAIVDDIIIDHIEANTSTGGATVQLYAAVKPQPVKKEG